MFMELSNELGLTQEPDSMKDLYNGVIYEGAYHLIYGEQGSGKTHWILSVIFDMFAELGKNARPVWFYDADKAGKVIKKYGDKLDVFREKKFFYRTNTPTNFFEKLARKADECAINSPLSAMEKPIIILDSLKNFMGELDYDKNCDVNKWWGLASSVMKCCSALIILHHVTDFYNPVTKQIDSKPQGNKNAILQSTHIAFSVINRRVTIVRNKCDSDMEIGDCVYEPDSLVLNYKRFNGSTKRVMFNSLGYYRNAAIKDRIQKDEGRLWSIQQIGSRNVINAM
jgi:hypothetical protein